MKLPLVLETGKASEAQIAGFLAICDAEFASALSVRVDISSYARKLATQAQCFEAWAGGELVGLVATYCNATDRHAAYITSVSVIPARFGQGIGAQLVARCIAHVRTLGFKVIELEVDKGSRAAIALYEKFGFKTFKIRELSMIMALNLTEN